MLKKKDKCRKWYTKNIRWFLKKEDNLKDKVKIGNLKEHRLKDNRNTKVGSYRRGFKDTYLVEKEIELVILNNKSHPVYIEKY